MFPIKLIVFYIEKLSLQWNMGDFSGAFWPQLDVPQNAIVFEVSKEGSAPFQLIYIITLVLIFNGVLCKNKIYTNAKINLFYLIFCGYISTYLLTENQNRYAYTASWLFIILSINGIDKIDKLIDKFLFGKSLKKCIYTSFNN